LAADDKEEKKIIDGLHTQHTFQNTTAKLYNFYSSMPL
jgi:hypothetical protein